MKIATTNHSAADHTCHATQTPVPTTKPHQKRSIMVCLCVGSCGRERARPASRAKSSRVSGMGQTSTATEGRNANRVAVDVAASKEVCCLFGWFVSAVFGCVALAICDSETAVALQRRGMTGANYGATRPLPHPWCHLRCELVDAL